MKVAKCGTPSGYLRHRRNGEEACQPCRTAASMASQARRQAEFEDERIELSGGQWVSSGGIMRWEPGPPPAEPAPTPIQQLIACPTCHARVDQTCRTKSGHRTSNHDSRLTPRLCKCGAKVGPRKRYCADCAREIDRAAKKAWHERKKAGRGVAA